MPKRPPSNKNRIAEEDVEQQQVELVDDDGLEGLAEDRPLFEHGQDIELTRVVKDLGVAFKNCEMWDLCHALYFPELIGQQILNEITGHYQNKSRMEQVEKIIGSSISPLVMFHHRWGESVYFPAVAFEHYLEFADLLRVWQNKGKQQKNYYAQLGQLMEDSQLVYAQFKLAYLCSKAMSPFIRSSFSRHPNWTYLGKYIVFFSFCLSTLSVFPGLAEDLLKMICKLTSYEGITELLQYPYCEWEETRMHLRRQNHCFLQRQIDVSDPDLSDLNRKKTIYVVQFAPQYRADLWYKTVARRAQECWISVKDNIVCSVLIKAIGMVLNPKLAQRVDYRAETEAPLAEEEGDDSQSQHSPSGFPRHMNLFAHEPVLARRRPNDDASSTTPWSPHEIRRGINSLLEQARKSKTVQRIFPPQDLNVLRVFCERVDWPNQVNQFHETLSWDDKSNKQCSEVRTKLASQFPTPIACLLTMFHAELPNYDLIQTMLHFCGSFDDSTNSDESVMSILKHWFETRKRKGDILSDYCYDRTIMSANKDILKVYIDVLNETMAAVGRPKQEDEIAGNMCNDPSLMGYWVDRVAEKWANETLKVCWFFCVGCRCVGVSVYLCFLVFLCWIFLVIIVLLSFVFFVLKIKNWRFPESDSEGDSEPHSSLWWYRTRIEDVCAIMDFKREHNIYPILLREQKYAVLFPQDNLKLKPLYEEIGAEYVDDDNLEEKSHFSLDDEFPEVAFEAEHLRERIARLPVPQKS